MDIFSVILEGAISSAASWATHHLLDTVIGCSKCREDHSRPLRNETVTELLCPSCKHTLPQLTNATPHTINPDRTIVAGHIDVCPWKSRGSSFTPELQVEWIHTKGRPLLAHLCVVPMEGGPPVATRWMEISTSPEPDQRKIALPQIDACSLPRAGNYRLQASLSSSGGVTMLAQSQSPLSDPLVVRP